MGSVISQMKDPEVTPLPTEKPTFDPHFGFSEPRELRVMKSSTEELMSAKMEMVDRDYCSHLLLEYWRCRADKSPLYYRCAPEKHAALQCQYEDYVLRMKEYERERRLRVRERRIQLAAAAN